jgi:hypothetical protein
VPVFGQAPAIDDVADQVNGLGFMGAQELDELPNPDGLHAQMDIRDKYGPDLSDFTVFRHPATTPASWVALYLRMRQEGTVGDEKMGKCRRISV